MDDSSRAVYLLDKEIIQMNRKNPLVLEISGNSQTILNYYRKGIEKGDYKYLKINVSGAGMQSFGYCCFYTIVTLAILFFFPLFLLCADCVKRKMYVLFNINWQVYEVIGQIVAATHPTQCYIVVQDNYLSEDGAAARRGKDRYTKDLVCQYCKWNQRSWLQLQQFQRLYETIERYFQGIEMQMGRQIGLIYLPIIIKHMLSQRKFNIQKFKMSEEMRTSILDEVRKVIQANRTDIDSAETLKRMIEQKYKGKWQVVIGKDMVVYFDQNIIKEFIILQTEIKTMIIFRKKKAQQIVPTKTQTDRWAKREQSQKIIRQ